ncbi:DUF302 domain-containing protein [Acidaminobacter hydrogenoformans]|uniref:Uncharacterized conserved protein, DUF302 family n=1 Tax=Acidaminobacter hydrogenoformans DSM 2784 TaxID=1120920 RepID=A0A1G5RS49_9FIRM|nr:DUF302 domain-containing protein [Acidaminobacter hydrogenoformans]SCZ76251.1 Uncharacterized conserved protein, DUF302 family [Acidaminobacter hydrogenoformans DSM 2784]
MQLNSVKYKVQTNKTPADAIDALKLELAKQSFGVLWELDFKEKLHEKGVETDIEFHLLEVCNPKKAKIALEEDIETGYFLPCRAVVYVKEGKTWIGMMKPTVLLAEAATPALMAVAHEVEAVLEDAIVKAR